MAVPVLKPQEVVTILKRLGFVEVRQRGAHKQFRHSVPVRKGVGSLGNSRTPDPFSHQHSDGRGSTVPFHKGKDIAPPLLQKIARDIGITVKELVRS